MRRVMVLLGVMAGLGLLFHLGGTVAYADDRGNNGTIKIQDSSGHEEDSHVCTFHISGMGFDKSASGTWSISGSAGVVARGAWTANASGSWRTADMTLASGRFTAVAKQTNTSGGEKRKNFSVDCAASQPAAPAGNGSNGPAGNGNSAGNQPASLPTNNGSRSRTGSRSKTGTGSKSKAGGSATGSGSQSRNNATNGASATAGATASVNGGTDNTASVSEHGETGAGARAGGTAGGGAQGNINVPGDQAGGNAAGNAGGNAGAGGGTTLGGGGQGTVTIPGTQVTGGAQGATGAGAQGNVNTPQNAAGVSPNVANLPSTSTDANGALTALGAILVASGALLLRRRETR